MPTFKFTSPDGAEYYGDGATPQEAFSTAEERSPAEIAAMRQRRAVKPEEGRQQSGFTEGLADTLVPGLGAARSLAGGEYGKAATEAAMSAAPFGLRAAPRVAAGILGSAAMSPSAIAEDSKFGFIEDENERKAADAAFANIKEYSTDPRSGRKTFDREATAKKRNEFFLQQQGIARTRGEEKRSLKEFEDSNAAALKKLTPDQLAEYNAINVPGDTKSTIMNRSDFLQRMARQRDELGKSWAEKHPPEMEELQLGAAGVSGIAPIYQAWRRARALGKSASEAEKAFLAATKSRAPASAKAEMALRANIADELDKINDPGFLKAIAKSAIIGGSVSGFATQAPNFVDVARLPAGSEGKQHALDTLLDPAQWGRAAWEGAAGSAAGRGIAEKFGSLPTQKARNAAALGTIREAQAAAQATKDKAAAARAAKRTAPTQAPSPSAADVLEAGNSVLRSGGSRALKKKPKAKAESSDD